jgi:hypothetical protein
VANLHRTNRKLSLSKYSSFQHDDWSFFQRQPQTKDTS